MNLNVTINMDNFIQDEDWQSRGETFSQYVICQVIESLTNELINDDNWKTKDIIHKIMDGINRENYNRMHEKIDQEIEKKISKTNITSKINTKVNNFGKEQITKAVLKEIDFKKIIQQEVRRIMDEKLK